MVPHFLVPHFSVSHFESPPPLGSSAVMVPLLCVVADKFPCLSNNDLKGKAELSLDEVCH